jgi:hypothetical protein
VKRSRLTNKECSIARAMEVVGDRWSILLLREAYYGTKRFDEFQYYLGVAPNILSARLKKFVDLGMMPSRICIDQKGSRFFPDLSCPQEMGRRLAGRVGGAAGGFQRPRKRAED